MSDMTTAQITRWIERHDEAHGRLVGEKLYERDRQTFDERLDRIEDTLKWAFRFAVAQSVAFLIAIVAYLLTRGVPT